LRDDFSNNVADGTSTVYFYDQTITTTNPKGWRAAFFWNTGNNQEMTLVSENQAFCSGDKAGDGEGISNDSSAVLGGLLDDAGNSAAALRVVASAAWVDPTAGNSGSTITVQGRLVDPVVDVQSTPVPASQYYPGEWLQIVQGAGVGQFRKIVSVAGGSNASGATVAFNVVPAFDVLPTMSQPNNSVVTMSPAYWQNMVLDNYVDQSQSRGCTKLNQNYKNQSGIVRPSPSSGAMGWFASTADSIMEGNEQHDSGGIGLYNYFAPASTGQTTSYAIVESSNEVQNNVIVGEYEWPSAYSQGGIALASGATNTPAYSSSWNPTNPPVTAFGITIAGNSISQAGYLNFNTSSGIPTPMGAIAVTPGINANGPTDSSGQLAWKITDSTLIFHNSLTNITGGGLNRAGIGVASIIPGVPEVWRSVLYANTCNSVQTNLIDYATGTVRYCPSGPSGLCECSGIQSIDVGVTASSSSSAVAIGGVVTYIATVTNNDASLSANGVALSLEPSAGIQISNMSVSSGTGSCDLSTNVCTLGTLTHGQSVQITVTGTGTIAGTWNNTFSVTHQDSDPVVANNGVLVTTVVGQMSVNLSSVFNVYGIFNDGSAVTSGGFDIDGYALSENLLGATVAWSGTKFGLGSAGVPSAVSNTTVALPAGRFSSLKLLAAAVNGNQTNQVFVVSYTDGTSTTIQQSLSDWCTPQTYAGESKASTMAYRVTSTGAKGVGPLYLYGYTFAVNGAKTIKGIALPKNRDVVLVAATLLPAS
jgi:hypothetical protein